ncbi:MAG: hypothetical protein JKY43_03095, partial [Phycisphaerales bacterium]|nr:hypothetical protein [Phycisphaerales bacterium]
MARSSDPKLPKTTALAGRVARLMWLRAWGGMLVGALPYAMGVGLLIVISMRWWMGVQWWWGVPVGVLILVVIGTGLAAWSKRPGVMVAAGRLDELAHTKSRYRSALELSGVQGADPSFAAIAIQRAEQSAGQADLPANGSKRWYEQSSIYGTATLMGLIVAAG